MNSSLLVFSIDFIYFLVCLYEKSLFQDFFFYFSFHLFFFFLSFLKTKIAVSCPKGPESGWRFLVKLAFFFLKCNFSLKQIDKPIVIPLLEFK